MPDISGREEERLAKLTKKDKNMKLNQITEGMLDVVFFASTIFILAQVRAMG